MPIELNFQGMKRNRRYPFVKILATRMKMPILFDDNAHFPKNNATFKTANLR